MEDITIELTEEENQEIEISLDDLTIDIDNIVEVKKYIKWDKWWKGEKWNDGKTPTKTEIKKIIKEVIPDEKLEDIIEEKVEKTIDEKKIIEEVVKKIPKPKDWKPWKDWKDLKFEDLTPRQKAQLEWPEWPRGIPWVWVWIATGGTTGQVLAKKSDTNYDTEWINDPAESDTLQSVTDRGNVTTETIEAQSFVTTWGLSTDFVKGDGTLDSTVYASDDDAYFYSLFFS